LDNSADRNRIARLRVQAVRYRKLAEDAYDQKLAAVLHECVRELEAEANAQELRLWIAAKAA
jgi:hypothetical protein